MPMVYAHIKPVFANDWPEGMPDISNTLMLQYACEEIVPAGLNSELGRLTPGSIEFISTVVDNLNIDVIIVIDAVYYEDRAANIDDRAKEMKEALNATFPGFTFAVFPKLSVAGWSSDTEDPEFNGDMSMASALARHQMHASRLLIAKG